MRSSNARHPAYQIVRKVAQEESQVERIVGEDTAVHLLEGGLRAVAARKRRSERSIRRLFEEGGTRASALIERIRVRVTEQVLHQGLPLSIVARWLGFNDAVTYRRFIRRRFRSGVLDLRRRVRESADLAAEVPYSSSSRGALERPSGDTRDVRNQPARRNE